MSTTTVLAGHTRFANARETPERGDKNPTAILTGPSPTPDPRSIMRGKSDAARTPPLLSLPAHPRTSPATVAVGQQRRCEHHRHPHWTRVVCERKGNHTTRRREYHRRLRWTPGVCGHKENPTTRRQDHHCRPRHIGTHHSPSMRRRDTHRRSQCGRPLLCAESSIKEGPTVIRGIAAAETRYIPPPHNSPSPTNHLYPACEQQKRMDNAAPTSTTANNEPEPDSETGRDNNHKHEH